MNLSHWIGSFSTVGLDSHLGFRQKGLREAKHFTFHLGEEKEEERAEEGERERISRHPAKEILVGMNFETAFIVLHRTQELYGLHLMHSTDCI